MVAALGKEEEIQQIVCSEKYIQSISSRLAKANELWRVEVIKG